MIPRRSGRGTSRHVRRAVLGLLPLAPVAALQADVVISEILYRPIAQDGVEVPAEEFIELHNTDPSSPANVGGWRFDKGVEYAFPPAATIPPGGHLVVAADIDAFNAKHPSTPTQLGGWSGRLSNSGERIRLVDAVGTEVDSVEYSDQGDWATRVRETLGGENGWTWTSRADEAGHSLELRNPALSNNVGQNWTSSADPGGSPGRTNSAAGTDLAPLIRNVGHAPAVPNFADTVTISARIDDEAPGAVNAVVRWRVSTAVPGPFESLPMADQDGDGVFEAKLPAQGEGTVVEFYVEASDGAQARTWPAATDQGQAANAHYQVDSAPQSPGDAIYRIIMTAADRRQWDGINRNSDAQLNATFIVSEGGRDAVRYRAGLRVRGNSSRTFDPPPMRINLPREDPWNGDTKLNVNSRYSWLQFVGMHFLGATGLPVPDAKRVRFRLNGEDEARGDGTMRGGFVHLEPIGDELVADKFPDDAGGNLYKKRSAEPDRDEKRWGVHFETDVVYDEPDWFREDDWSKLTNEGEDDWSDLQHFVEVMHQATGPDYLEQVGAVVDIDQWVRWFAAMTILNTYETNLSNGIDDDYSMYRGLADPRFVLLPHDLDTILGEGDTNSDPDSSIFPMLTANIPRPNEDGRIPQLVPFFEHPVIRRQFFAELKDLLEHEFSKENFDAGLENHLGGWATPADLAALVAYMDARREFILGEIEPALEVASGLPTSGGFPFTTQPTTALSGAYDLLGTAEVRVNGRAAALDPVAQTWSIGGIALAPGVNRIVVQAVDASGAVTGSRHIDVWFDDGNTEALTGPIAADRTLVAAAGPYRVSGEVVVEAGATLTIEPGTNLWFEPGAKITVHGILQAVGTEFSRIRLGPVPGAPLAPDPAGNGGLPDGPPKWGGVQFVDTLSDRNVLSFVDVLHAQSEDGSVGVHRSEVLLDHMGFAGSHLRLVYADSSSVIIRNSTFPDMFAPGESPDSLDLDNISEHVKGEGAFPDGGHFIIQGNVFGTNAGHNDVIDVDSGRRPDPILQILDNVFLGAGDEQLDLGGDVYIAGNRFMNVFKDDETSDRGYANAISTGDAVTDATVVVVRNVFHDVDHAINLKRGTAAIFENNTVVTIHPDFDDRFGNPNVASAINLYVDEPGASAGDGAYAANNIFHDCPRVFGNADLPAGTTTPLELHHSLVSPELAATAVGSRPGTILDLGTGNVVGDPHFVDEASGNFALQPGSPARGAGLAGQDLGADVPDAIAITGEPPTVTAASTATLTVGGPGMFAFRYRVNGGAWSAVTPIGSGFDPVNGTVRTATIELAGLTPGSYTVEVEGTDFAGNVQDTPTVSATWTVDPAHSRLVINEVLASNGGTWANGGTFPDLIELHNAGAAAIDLAGMTITDDPAVPDRFTFPAGTSIPAGGFLVLFADADAAAPGIHLGFALDDDGEGVHLRDAAANGGGLIDSVVFGLQVPGFSIGRTGRDGGTWALTRVTPGAANQPQPFGDPRKLRLNEWLAAPEVLFADDFIEIFNPDPLPVPLAGLAIGQDPEPEPARNVLPALSFIPPGGFSVFRATGEAGGGPRELDFRLSSTHEWLYLFDQDGSRLDQVHLQAEGEDVSRGRLPDGGPTFGFFTLPTPGMANPGTLTSTETTTLVPLTATWRFEQSDVDPGPGWPNPGFNDSAWPSGPGLLYQDNDPLGGPAGTPLNLNPPTTHYFRHAFTFPGDPAAPMFDFDVFADDGAVVYLNGTEIRRLRMPAGEITHATFASGGQGNASREGPFPIPAGLVVQGENVLAASVHQDDGSSGDVVFGLEFRATLTETTGGDPEYDRALALLNGLRITELMFHPAGGEALEFIELQNLGNVPLELGGVRFTDGVDFVFPDMTLEPGEYVLVVADPAAFEAEYGAAVRVAGRYSGRLDNDGEKIVLQLPAPFEAAILRFEYNDAWFREADGGGPSLEVLDVTAPAASWDSPANWHASASPGGTPAQVSPPVVTSPAIAVTTLGDPFLYRITATNSPNRFAAEGLPPGLELDTRTGEISGKATAFGRFEMRLSAINGGGTGEADLSIDVAASGPLAGFAWSGITGPLPVGTAVPVRATAVDAAGRTVVDFAGSVPVGAFVGAGGGSSVVLTECWDRSPDYFEIQNVSAGTVDTAGWFVAVNQAFSFGGASGANAAAPTTWSLPPAMAPGEVIDRTDDEGNNYFGGDIPWNHNGFFGAGRRGWVMLVDDVGTLVDFVAWGYSAAEIASIDLVVRGFGITVGDGWNGAAVPWGSESNAALLRSGGEDTDSPADWRWAPLSRGTRNAGLEVPFPGGFEPIAASPGTAAFAGGVWNGSMTFGEAATDVLLVLDDDAGHLGLSGRFDVAVLPAPVIVSPGRVTAVAGQPFSYQMVATNFPASFGAADLPEGVAIDTASGLVAGTPSAAGTTGATLSATNAGGTGTHPLVIEVLEDGDGDGMPDPWETANGLDPRAPGDADLDADGDGSSNRAEFLAGTGARDPASFFRIESWAWDATGDGLVLRWRSVPGRRYRLLASPHLGAWVSVAGSDVLADGPVTEIVVDGDLAAPGFLRVATGLDY